MNARNALWNWLTVAVLALATFVVGMVAGYRADEASVVADGESVLNLAEWRAALWTLISATVVAGLIAVVATVRRASGATVKRVLPPAALIAIGAAASVVFLPLVLVAVAGAVWLILNLIRNPAQNAIPA